MTLQLQVETELRLRAQLLPKEVTVWRKLTEANAEGMGIHRSQVRAIGLLFEELEAKQQGALDALDAAQGREEFAESRVELELQLTAAHGVMAIFRYILAQREDERYFREVLDVADLVAADCYRLWVKRVVDLGAINKDQFRVPPLTYLNSTLSPAAITRRHAFGAFKMPLDGYLDLKLPISVISLPFHHSPAVWTFCSIYHEVGHLLDQDLGLLGALRPHLQQKLQASERVGHWDLWLREMIADTFGVLLGGESFVFALTKLLLLPTAQVTTISPADLHPTHYVRIFLLGELLRGTGVTGMAQAVDTISQLWRELYGEPADLAPYVAECPATAHVLLHQPLDKLHGHSLVELASSHALSSDAERTIELARYLRTGFKRPDVKSKPLFPMRLVPAAAATAVRGIEVDLTQGYRNIHVRALEFVRDLRSQLPQFLDVDISPKSEAYLRELVRNLDFASVEVGPW